MISSCMLVSLFFFSPQAGSEAMGVVEERKSPSENKKKEGGGDDALTNRRLSIRTRFCDDFFEDCTMSRGIKQVCPDRCLGYRFTFATPLPICPPRAPKITLYPNKNSLPNPKTNKKPTTKPTTNNNNDNIHLVM